MSEGPALPGGGVILGQPQPQLPQRTQQITVFHSSAIGLYCLLDEDNICTGYRVEIFDGIFNHKYQIDFEDDVMNTWRDSIPRMPKVGEKAEGGEVVAGTGD